MSVQSTTHKFISYFYKSHSNGGSETGGTARSAGTAGLDTTGTTGTTGREIKEERDFGPSSIFEKDKSPIRAQEHRRDFSSFHRAYSRAANEARFNAENIDTSGPKRQQTQKSHHSVNEGFNGLNLRAIMTFLHHLSDISSQSTDITGEQTTEVAQDNPVFDSNAVSLQEPVMATPSVPENVIIQPDVSITPPPATPNEVSISVPPAEEVAEPVVVVETQPESENVQVTPPAEVSDNSNVALLEEELPQTTMGPLVPVDVVVQEPVIVPNNLVAPEPIIEEVGQVAGVVPVILSSNPIVTDPIAEELEEVAAVAPTTQTPVVEAALVANVGEVFEVSSAAGLQELLSQDISGGTIKLLAGDYIGVNFDGFNPAQNVSIISADPNNPVRMAKVNITNSSNISFANIEFRADLNSESYWSQYVVRVSGSDNIDFSDNVFSGGDGMQNSGLIGLYVDSSDNVSVINSEFTNTARGAIFSNTNGLKVEGNNVHNIQTDGFNFVGVTDVVIDKNNFSDFYPLEGDHADYIQFWLVGAKQGTEDVTISNNFMAQSGGDRVQGIFITDTDEFTNKNFSIENNSVYQSGFHGITISGVEDLVIENNTVISSDEGRDTWIKVSDATNAQILNNITNTILLDPENTVVSEGNLIAKLDGVRGTAYTDLFKGILDPASNDPNLFLTHAEIAAGADISALLLRQEEDASKLS